MISRLLLALSLTTALAAQPADLEVRFDSTPLDAQRRSDVIATIETRVPFVDAQEIKLDLNILGGLSLVSWSTAPGVTCAEKSEHWLQCQVAPAAAGETTTVTMRVEYRSDVDHYGNLIADLVWRDGGFLPEQRYVSHDLYRYLHEFAVTHGDDGGAGSLRQAILDANAACDAFTAPCLIRFDLGLPATIFARTPLPAITGANVTLEGRGQVTIDGILLDRPANGITGGAGVTLRGLTIRRFPENGVEVTSTHHVRIESCLIADNGSRGVTVLRGAATLTDSVIRDNRRSGVFIHGGTAALYRNRIENNGASGVFAGPTNGAVLRDNVITGNAHFGVATVANNQDVDISRRNVITGNRLGQIDIGLDGRSQFPMPVAYEFQQPNAPILWSATYDPFGDLTTIRGRIERVRFSSPYLTYEINFYASDGVDHYLGGMRVGQPDFDYTVRGDLRGRLITATSTRVLEFPQEWLDRATSELSAPIEVH